MNDLKIFDSHTHINSSAFDNDVPEVIQRSQALDVSKMLVLGYDEISNQRLEDLVKQYPGVVYGAVGCHPEDALAYDDEYEAMLMRYLQQDGFVAVGEIGMDYYHDSPKQAQVNAFERQIELAQKLDLPIVVHNRDAIEDCYDILKNMNIKKSGAIMHSFNGDATWAEKFLDLGMYLSYSGVVTFNNAKEVKQAAEITPMDRILVETDAPYLTPMPFRGRKNEPAMTRYTLEFLAQAKGVSASQLAQATFANTQKVLKINN